MAQNIYDNPEFFAGYSKLGRSVDGLDGAAEWPALQAMLPDLAAKNVADLGCGFGWFCRWARQHGAAQVVGFDVSQNMLDRAAAMTQDAAISYVRADLEQLQLQPNACDLVYSSLALHYIADLRTLLRQVHQSLLPGGSLVFSVEHPIYTAPANPGWSSDATGRKIWPIDRYLEEGPRTTDWLTKGVIKQHRTVATYINMLLHAGFTLSQIVEWGPTDAQIASRPVLADERQRPPFLLVAAHRR